MDIHTLARRPKKMTVLAVDDEPHVGRALKRSLEAAFPRLVVEATTDPRARSRWTTAARCRTSSSSDLTCRSTTASRNLHEPPLPCTAARRPVVVAMSRSGSAGRSRRAPRARGPPLRPENEAFVAAMSAVIGGIVEVMKPPSEKGRVALSWAARPDSRDEALTVLLDVLLG